MLRNFAVLVTLFLFIIIVSIPLSARDKLDDVRHKSRSSKSSVSNTPEYLPGAILLKFKTEAHRSQLMENSTTSGIASIDAKIQRFAIHRIEPVFRSHSKTAKPNLPDLSAIYRLEYSSPYDAAVVAKAFISDPNIEFAEPIYIFKVENLFEPNDPLYRNQQHLQQIKAPDAWDVITGDSTVVVAILDTGVDWDHPDLAANIWRNTKEIIDGNDNDGNGKIDDVRGWDWVTGVADAATGEDAQTPDNDPIDFNGHGTH
ncbi:MAG TPA: S8 family serine peptidase, partial [bacterium]